MTAAAITNHWFIGCTRHVNSPPSCSRELLLSLNARPKASSADIRMMTWAELTNLLRTDLGDSEQFRRLPMGGRKISVPLYDVPTARADMSCCARRTCRARRRAPRSSSRSLAHGAHAQLRHTAGASVRSRQRTPDSFDRIGRTGRPHYAPYCASRRPFAWPNRVAELDCYRLGRLQKVSDGASRLFHDRATTSPPAPRAHMPSLGSVTTDPRLRRPEWLDPRHRWRAISCRGSGRR